MNPDYKNMSADRIAEKQRQDYEAERHDNSVAVGIMLGMIALMIGASFDILWWMVGGFAAMLVIIKIVQKVVCGGEE